MDFVETTSEIGFSESSLMELKRLFLQEQPIEKATLFDVGKFYTYRKQYSLQSPALSLSSFPSPVKVNQL